MKFIIWDDKYNVGVELIDHQHKELCNMINDLQGMLQDALLHGECREVLGKMFNRIVEYTSLHFLTEEDYMKRYLYDGYAEHKKEHDNLMEKTNNLLDDFNSGEITLAMPALIFFRDYLYSHIIRTDSLFSEFFINKGVK